MCGIVGFANLNSRLTHQHDAEELLRGMCERLTHRGPDDEGVFVESSVALGMRRLSIIDLFHGEQPAFNEDRSIAVVLNGEIYNYRELRKELEGRGHRFRSESDTEVLPHLYEEYEDAMVEHLNGMFAFALWDLRKRKLVIARDRFGEKPLYWGVFDNQLVFASEPKAMLVHHAVKPDLNLQALRRYLSFDYVPAPLSIYEGINKLPAAHTLTLEDGVIKVNRYWQLSFKKQHPQLSVDEAAEQLQHLVSDSVRMRLVSDVPLGVLLSGGIDSSTVAALASMNSSEAIKTFSISFVEPSFDESSYARKVSEHIGSQHHEHHLSVNLATNLIGEISSWLDEPLSDPSILPTFLLSRFTRSHVTVALGGDGGDELFAGYPMYYAHKVASVYSRVPRFLKNGFIEPIVSRLPVSTKNISFDLKARRFVSGMKYDDVARHHVWFGSFAPHEQELLMSEEVKRETDNDIYADARKIFETCDADNIIEQAQFLDMQFYLAEDILTKVDRASMAVSLEVRAPFLDHRIAEFAASLPAHYKQKGRIGKYILKKAMKPLLPDFVTKRSKKGFGVPIADWLKKSLRTLTRDMLSPERIKRNGLFNADYVQRLLNEHENGSANHAKNLWTLLMFELWRESFVETPRRIENLTDKISI